MTSSLPDTPEGATTTTIADALREVADWLDAHPEVTTGRAFIPVAASTREDLERLAAALGDRAVERESYNAEVEIEGRFGVADPLAIGGVRVYGRVPIRRLAGEPEPPRPKYRPILPPRDEADQ